MEKIFSTKTDADLYIQVQLEQIKSLSFRFPGLDDAVTSAFAVVEYPRQRPGEFALIVPIYRWVVRDEDLQLMDSILDGLKTAAGANFFMTTTATASNAVVTASIGLVSTVYKILKSAKNKGAFLAKDQFEVILCLKGHPDGLTLDQLHSRLNLVEERITKEKLMELLESLKTVYSTNGTKITVVVFENHYYKAPGI